MPGGSLIELVDRDEALRMDEELVRMACSQSAVRLATGDAFVALGNGYQELGFSTFEGYVRERCVRSPRWARDTRALAARLAKLPRIRARLALGRMGWCMAEELARHAAPEDEEELLEATRGMTVRQVRRALRERGGESEQGSREEERYGTLDLRMSFEEACGLAATRPMAELITGSKAPGEWLASLVGEGQSWFTIIAPDQDPLPEDVESKQRAWVASIEEGERRIDRREARAEATLPSRPQRSRCPASPPPPTCGSVPRAATSSRCPAPTRGIRSRRLPPSRCPAARRTQSSSSTSASPPTWRS